MGRRDGAESRCIKSIEQIRKDRGHRAEEKWQRVREKGKKAKEKKYRTKGSV